MPQQRSRVFILAYRTLGKGLINLESMDERFSAPQRSRGPMSMVTWQIVNVIASKWELGPSEAFPVSGDLSKKYELVPRDLNTFTKKSSQFGSSVMLGRLKLFQQGHG